MEDCMKDCRKCGKLPRYLWKFIMNKKEQKLYQEFQSKHDELHKEPYDRQIGGGFEIRFQPTNIGSGISIKCLTCDEMIDITDCSDW